jgi:hypothetical protein
MWDQENANVVKEVLKGTKEKIPAWH